MAIYFKNFQPNKKQKLSVEEKINQLMKNFPSESAYCCCIEEVHGESVRVSFRVRASRGQFGTVALGETLDRALSQVFSRLREQLKEWHKARFKEPAEKGEGYRIWVTGDELRSLKEICKKEVCPIFQEHGVWVGG